MELILPGGTERTKSAGEESLTDVQATARPRAVPWLPAQSQFGPGYHLRLPKRTTVRKFVFIFKNFRHSGGIAKITQQLLGVKRSLVGTDEL